jgi:hypothetical protein
MQTNTLILRRERFALFPHYSVLERPRVILFRAELSLNIESGDPSQSGVYCNGDRLVLIAAENLIVRSYGVRQSGFRPEQDWVRKPKPEGAGTLMTNAIVKQDDLPLAVVLVPSSLARS